MKPSVGRIVHFPRYVLRPDNSAVLMGPQAALITAVRLDGTVCLTVFDELGRTHARDFVEFSDEPRAGYWNWPPRT